jgi:hypothetical protein
MSQTVAGLIFDIVRWAVNTAGAGQKSNTYKVVVGKRERKEPLRKVQCRVKNNVKVDLVVTWLE